MSSDKALVAADSSGGYASPNSRASASSVANRPTTTLSSPSFSAASSISGGAKAALALALQGRQQTVFIKLDDRPKFGIAVEKTSLVEELKHAIADATGLPWATLELVKPTEPTLPLRNADSTYERGIRAGDLLQCVRCPLEAPDVARIFVHGKVVPRPPSQGGLTVTVSDAPHTKRLDLTAKAFQPMLLGGLVPLCTLKLSNCGLGDVGCAHLKEALAANRTLQHLVLSHNCVTDKGAGLLAALVQRSKTLRSLDLSHNRGVGDDGVTDLCEALTPDSRQPDRPVNTTLRVLDLSGLSMMTDSGVEHLAVAVKAHMGLRELRLRSVKVTTRRNDDDVRMVHLPFNSWWQQNNEDRKRGLCAHACVC
jgi:hypothetical protein